MAKNNKQKNDSDQMSFEEALAMLTDIVSKIEKGEVPLQDSIEQYERGMSLIKHCREILQKAEERIEKITESENK
jgi:exodeoxyribonuclease VII small subunit